MKLYQYLYKKINDEMRMIYITESMPKKKIKLDPLDPQDINVDISTVSRWSNNNKGLYDLLISNGMAEFICNKEFLNQFYTHLQFLYSGIIQIDVDVNKLSKIKVLNLFQNKISVIQNIPLSCKQLYLDFNQISNVKLKHTTEIQLLTISHNKIDDKVLGQIIKRAPQLRCLNISHNRIENIRLFVQNIKKCPKLKILISRNNPISILSFYWDYLTTQILFDWFDNQKYVKPEPIKVVEPKEQKKQQKKQQKKEAKKDSKKGAKVEEKPVEEEKKIQVKIEAPKIKTDEDYLFAKIKIQINVLEGLSGIIYDPSIFPQQNLNIKKTQSCFWVEADLYDKKFTTQQTKISMDSIVPDGQINRIGFQLKIQENVSVNFQNFLKLNKGMTIFVYKQQPIVDTDPDSGEQKVVLTDQKQIKMKTQCIGGTFINLQDLWSMKKKEISKNCKLFKQQAVVQPLFKKPLQNEQELISKNKVQFDTKLAILEEQRRKKQEQQQAAKAQKKGGKDTKKAPAKKQTKKDTKQVVGEKRAVQKCTFPMDGQQYRYLGEQKMYKHLKQQLGVRVLIE